jgi:N utilization substance protein B
MVNRVLIRLKVVQMLYSYMLTRSEFKIESPVETSSPDRRYSYQAYAELLLLLLEMSGLKVVRDRQTPASVVSAVTGAKFEDSRTARFLIGIDDVRELMNANSERMTKFDGAVPDLAQRLKMSMAYRDFGKIKKPEVADEITFWTSVIRAIVIKTPAVVDALRTNPDFTVRGMEMGAKMLCDTLSSYSDTRNVLADSRRDLQTSLDKAYELYHAILWLPVELTRAQEQRIEAAKDKYLPTAEELNPDMRFVNGALPRIIAENADMEEYRKAHPFEWNDDPILVQHLLDLVLASDVYKAYMEAPGEKTLADEAELWRQLLKSVVLPSDDITESLENRSIFWNDDIDIMASFALKTIKQISRDGDAIKLLPEFKDEEDANFGTRLFGLVVDHRDEYRELIDEFINVKRWDSERLALMDIVILQTALAEVLEFPNIPLTVTANEYVEIANWYSNPRSGSFINGMLVTITDKLRREGRTLKNFNTAK